MVDGDRVTGLLDFGGMKAGHVFMDLSRLHFHRPRAAQKTGHEPVVGGYTKGIPLA